MFGGVEAGGTKFRCAVGTGPDDLRAEVRIDTRSPAATLGEVVRFFAANGAGVSAIGVGCFGPIDLNQASKTYGYVTSTPKVGWSQVNVAGALQEDLGVPIGIDTDVAAAALGEGRWGAAQGLSDFIYVTVGTGIGGAIVAGGRLVHGLMHPEIGHMRIPRAAGDAFSGACPFHGDCLEGLVSGAALRQRWGIDPATRPPEHPAWEQVAHELAAGLVNLILTTSPRRIILGGGVMEQAQLLAQVRERVFDLLGGYLGAPGFLADGIEDFLVSPGLGWRSGVLGALLLGERAYQDAGRA